LGSGEADDIDHRSFRYHVIRLHVVTEWLFSSMDSRADILVGYTDNCNMRMFYNPLVCMYARKAGPLGYTVFYNAAMDSQEPWISSSGGPFVRFTIEPL